MSWHEMLNIVLFNIKYILKITIISTFFVFVILFFIYPRTYNSTVVILPPEKNSSMGGLSSLIANQDLSGLLTGNVSNANAQLFAEMLRSRTAALYVLDKLKIQYLYDEDDKYEAAKELAQDLNIEITKENVIKLSVDVKTKYIPLILSDQEKYKQLAADISNTYAEALDKINRNKLISKSKRARIFIEAQLTETKTKLDSVEIALMLFQKKNKTISLPDQLKAAVESAAKIKSEIVKTEVELELVKYNVQEDSRTVQSLSQKLFQLKEQLDKMEVGNQDYLLAFKNVPEIGKELAVLYREIKIQNEVYILLQQQYYKEKIQENRDLPTVEVLDEAVPPNKKSSPKVVSSSLSSALLIFVLSSILFLFKNRKSKIK
jgi:tyrosine-protein kinase Etk/Wzc